MLVDQFEHLTFRFSPQPKHLLLVVLEIRLWGLSCRSCLIAARKREAKIGNKSVHMHISVMCGVADSCSFVFFKCVLCNATDLWWNDATFLNKSILKLPWIKFSGAILDDRMFTFIIFPFFFFWFLLVRMINQSLYIHSLLLKGWLYLQFICILSLGSFEMSIGCF